MQVAPQPLPLPLLADADVVRRVKDGEIGLFEIVMRRYNQRLYRIVRSILGNESEVEDVLQDAYLSAFRHLEQFAGRSSFATWLTKIAVHEAMARARRGRRFPLSESSEPNDATILEIRSPLPDPEETAARRELMRLVEEAVDHLPAAFREVFVMREIEQMSQAETADCLDIKEETVKTRLHRARGHIESYLLARAGQEIRTAYSFGDARCTAVVMTVLSRIARGQIPGP